MPRGRQQVQPVPRRGDEGGAGKLEAVLEYIQEQGPHEEILIKQSLRAGRPLPDRIKNAPRLHLGSELYLAAYLDLTTCRTFGMAVGPIPWTAAMQWCREHGIVEDQRDRLWAMVSNLDISYLKRAAEKRKAQATAPRLGGSGGRP